ncbi:MAG: zinc ribbon domain-containing protein [Gemmatimonadales bacterium]|jgi:hypothetical protein
MTAVYFFAAILVVLLAAVLIAPLLDRAPDAGPPSTPAERLEEALEALRELEFEHETDKIGDADYRALRAEYAAAAIAARDAGAEAPEGSEAGCSVCGASLAPGAKFCSRCGTPVGERSGVTA